MTTIEVMTTRSLAAVKAHFSQVIDEVAGTHERVTVTRNGSPVAVILAVEDYESLLETPGDPLRPPSTLGHGAGRGGDGRR
jgi:prevent-host-death family protein